MVTSERRTSGRWWIARLLPLGVLALLVAAFALAYVREERTYYGWDQANFHNLTLARAIQLRETPPTSPGRAYAFARAVVGSTAEDYSAYPTLPVVPIVLALGASRTVYVMSLALLYLLPLALVTGGLATRLLPAAGARAFWAGTLALLLTPTAWLVTLRGFPDAGAAALVLLATYVWLGDPELRRPRSWLAVGLCCALAVLLRRHYAYDVVATFCAMGLLALLGAVRLRGGVGATARRLVTRGSRIVLAAAATVVFLALFGWPFVRRVTTVQFQALYASYQFTPGETAAYYLAQVGLLIVVVAAVGYALGIATRAVARWPAIALATIGVASVLQWVFRVRQLALHFTLHFAPVLALGVVAAGAVAHSRLRGAARRVALASLAAALLAGWLVGVAPWLPRDGWLATWPAPLSARGLLPLRTPPLRRADKEELDRLVDTLRAAGAGGRTLYVVASSESLNETVIWQAYRTRHESPLSLSSAEFWTSGSLGMLLWTPTIDSRDAYALPQLMQAQTVVTTSPLQLHLRPEEQDVVRVAHEAIAGDWELARDFVRRPGHFRLEGGVLAHLYDRIRPTELATAVRTFTRMRAEVGQRPGSQLDWVGLASTRRSGVIRSDDGRHRFWAELDEPAPALRFEPLTGPVRVAARLGFGAARCGGVVVRALAVDPAGRTVAADSARRRADDTGATVTLQVPAAGGHYLVVSMERDGPGNGGVRGCTAELADIVTTPTG